MDNEGPDSDQLLSGLEGSAGDSAVLRMRLGTELRRLREAAGVTPERAGFEIRASRSKISRLENGRVKLKSRDVTDLLILYGVTDEAVRSKFLALVMQSNVRDWWGEYGDILPGWFETYLGLEAAAATIRSFEVQFVHGLFQTADYARAVAGLGRKTRRKRRSSAGSSCASSARNCSPGRIRPTSGRSWTRRCCAVRSAVPGSCAPSTGTSAR